MKDEKYWEGLYESIVGTQMNRLIPKDKSESYPAKTAKEAQAKLWKLDKEICAHFSARQGDESFFHAPGESYYKWADLVDLYSLDSWKALRDDIIRRRTPDASARQWYAERGADGDEALAKLLYIIGWLEERYTLKENNNVQTQV